jgi:hypothetical protein
MTPLPHVQGSLLFTVFFFSFSATTSSLLRFTGAQMFGADVDVFDLTLL